MFLFLHLILQDLWTLFHKSYTQTEAEYESCIYMKYISYIHSYFIEVTDAQEIDFPFSGLTTELRASSCRRITDMYSMRHVLHITFFVNWEPPCQPIQLSISNAKEEAFSLWFIDHILPVTNPAN